MKITKVQELALTLLSGAKITNEQIHYLRKYHMHDASTLDWDKLSQQDIVNTHPGSFTPARKARRTSLLRYGHSPNVDKLIMRSGLK